MSGCPMLWNSSAVAKGLADYVKNNELESLDESHIDILQACMLEDLSPKEIWIDIFTKLQ